MRFAPPDIPGFTSIPIDAVVLIFALVLSIVTSMLLWFGSRDFLHALRSI